jgi:hypothetical protein
MGKDERRRGITLNQYAGDVDSCPADAEAIADDEKQKRHFADRLMKVGALHPDHVYLASSSELEG